MKLRNLVRADDVRTWMGTRIIKENLKIWSITFCLSTSKKPNSPTIFPYV
jgi:hypothetical protein